MASVSETYGRSLPGSFTTLNLNSSTIHTKYGLTMLMTAAYNITDFDEILAVGYFLHGCWDIAYSFHPGSKFDSTALWLILLIA